MDLVGQMEFFGLSSPSTQNWQAVPRVPTGSNFYSAQAVTLRTIFHREPSLTSSWKNPLPHRNGQVDSVYTTARRPSSEYTGSETRTSVLVPGNCSRNWSQVGGMLVSRFSAVSIAVLLATR